MTAYKKTITRRKKRVRSKVLGTKSCPRISVFRSNKYMYLQAINDKDSRSIIGISSKSSKIVGSTPSERAYELGRIFGEMLFKIEIKYAKYDRGPYKYHGKVKKIAEGIRVAKINI